MGLTIRNAAWMTMAGTSLLLGMATASQAQNFNWIGAAGGSWDTATNWSPNTVPNAAAAQVTINNSSTVLGTTARSVGVMNIIGTASKVTLGNGARLSSNNTVNCIGTIELNSTGTATYFQPVGNVALNGNNGVLLLGPNANNIVADQSNANAAVDTLTVSSTFIIRGAGSIRLRSGMPVVNPGLIEANTTAAPLRVRPGTLNNAGILRASNGATLSVESPIATTGTLEALASSTIEFNGATGSNGAITGTGKLRATGATTNVILSSIRVGALEIVNSASQRIGNSGASKVTTLTINTGGKLDLVGGSMIVDYTTTSPASTIRSQIATGRNNGAWNGAGIHSSSLATLPRYAVGYAENSSLGLTTFGGQAVDSTAILMKITLAGDTNLNGQVGFDDLLSLAQHYGQTTNVRWLDGDFDYNGNVGFSDLLAMAQNYGNNALSTDGIGTAQFQADWALAQSLVPEPTVLALLGLPLTRRRRA